MENATPATRCEFCGEMLADAASYRLLAWESMGAEPDGPEFAYELCRPCYYAACGVVCELMSRILATQTARLKAYTQAVGLEI